MVIINFENNYDINYLHVCLKTASNVIQTKNVLGDPLDGSLAFL